MGMEIKKTIERQYTMREKRHPAYLIYPLCSVARPFVTLRLRPIAVKFQADNCFVSPRNVSRSTPLRHSTTIH